MSMTSRYAGVLNLGKSVFCFCVALAFAGGLGQAIGADALWRFEHLRVFDALCDGEYSKALDIAKTFNREFKKAKRSFKAKDNWQEHEWATVSSHLLIGLAERMCGDYGAAETRFGHALAELTQIRQRNMKLYADLRKQAETAEEMSLFHEMQAYGAKAEAEAHQNGILPNASSAKAAAQAEFVNFASKLAMDQMASQKRAAADGVAEFVRTTNSLMVLNYDALGTLALDKSLPLSRSSLKSLRDAQKFLSLAQEVREDSRFGLDSSYSIYGSEQISFLINYGNMYLKRAELKRMHPDLPPLDEDVDMLLERASDYLTEAEDMFSSVKKITDDLRSFVHEGSVQEIKNQCIARMERDPNAKGNKSAYREQLDRFFLGIQKLLLGRADLDFKQSELALLKLLHDHDQGGLETNERMERFDEAEQRLVNASDNIKLITDTKDHPFLITCYAEIAALEAVRAKMEVRKPSDDYTQYLTMAEDLMASKGLSPETVQGVYLRKAQDLWREAQAAAR